MTINRNGLMTNRLTFHFVECLWCRHDTDKKVFKRVPPLGSERPRSCGLSWVFGKLHSGGCIQQCRRGGGQAVVW